MTWKGIDLDRIVTALTVHDANRMRTELLQELRRAQPAATARQRLGDFATSWLRSKLPTLKAATRTHYADVLDNYVLPKLGDYYLDAITTDDLVVWRDQMFSSGARPATVNSRLRVLKTLLRDALHEQLIPRDITSRVHAVREFRSDDDRNCLTPGELAALLQKVRELRPKWHPFFLALAYTGLRFGEITALRWDDVDDVSGLLRISRAQWKGKIDTTKTGVVRTVPLLPELADALHEQRVRLLKSQHPGMAEGWVFPSQQRGKFALMHNTAPAKALATCCGAAGIKHRFTIHGFRRTFNNLVRTVAEGVVVRSMTGHASADMTDHYSWVDPEEKRTAVASIVALVQSAAG